MGIPFEYFSSGKSWNLIYYFLLFLLQFWGGSVILSVGYAHDSRSTLSGLIVTVTRVVLKTQFSVSPPSQISPFFPSHSS